MRFDWVTIYTIWVFSSIASACIDASLFKPRRAFIYEYFHVSRISATLAHHKTLTMENANEVMYDVVDQLMNEVYKLLMMNHISAFDETGCFDYSQFEDRPAYCFLP
jgi:hypothetical protein